MRIRWITAEAFGALADKRLDLSEGLNVIVGPNDSGKSTWHAALYAALCGHPPQSTDDAEPRARTTQAELDRRFRRERRPRRLKGWSVEAELEFDEDHRFVVHQNLLAPHTSNVRPVGDDSDVDSLEELRYDGGIDAAGLVGLNRRSYAATAWVTQDRAMLLDEEGSREELRRVISEFVDDAAAVTAAEHIREYRRWQIGSDTDLNSALGQAEALATRRRNEREQAKLLQENLIRTERELETARANLAGLERQLRVADAIVAKAKAKRLAAEVAQLTADVEQLRSELARLRGIAIGANTQSAAVYKFPGYVDKDSELDEGFAPGPIPATAADPLGTGAGVGSTTLGAAANPLVTSPITSTVASPFSKQEPEGPASNVTTLPVAKPYPGVHVVEVEPARRGRTLDELESVVFPSLFFGGLVLAALGTFAAITLNSTLALGLAIAAGAVAVIGLGFRIVIRRRAARRAKYATVSDTIDDVIDKDVQDNPLTPQIEGEVNELRYAPEHVYTERIERAPDDPRIREYDIALQDAERRLRLKQQEQWQADDEASRQAAGLNPYELYTHDITAEDAQRAKQKAVDDVATGQREVGDRERDHDDVVRRIRQYASLDEAEEALREAETAVVALRHRDRLLEETLEHLSSAVAAARDKIADGVETRMREYLPEITRFRHAMVDVDQEMRMRVGDQTQPMDDPTPGSRGTIEQSHLLRLIALGRQLGYGHEAGPLLLDDVTSNADSKRMPRILELLYRISEQRQVVIFAHEDAVGDWALKRAATDPRVTVYVLETVESAPVPMTSTPAASTAASSAASTGASSFGLKQF